MHQRMQINKKLWWSLCKCANERHRNDFIKYITPWWFENNLLTRCVSCSVRSSVSRPSPKLASSRLRQRLFGAAASQTSRRKPCYRQSDLFSNSSWLYYFMHMHYCSFLDSILITLSAFQFLTPARKPPTTSYLPFWKYICSSFIGE